MKEVWSFRCSVDGAFNTHLDIKYFLLKVISMGPVSALILYFSFGSAREFNTF
jgi:hypothetical protein